jgi:hypothetical protein
MALEEPDGKSDATRWAISIGTGGRARREFVLPCTPLILPKRGLPTLRRLHLPRRGLAERGLGGMHRSLARLSASESSHRDLSSAVFITNIAESDFRYTQVVKVEYRTALLNF